MKYLLIILSSIIAHVVTAQNVDYLDHNNTRVTLSREGNFFYDETNNSAGFEVPSGSGNHYIGETRFYFVGKDVNNQIYAVQGGSNNNGSDVASGPYSLNPTSYLYWGNQSWQICQDEIDIYIAWWEACEGPNQDPVVCQSVTTPSNASLSRIYDWPAHGDVNEGEPYFLAPFYDHPESTVGVYDPAGGDYPLIKGCCATWRIENDQTPFSHEVSGTDAMGIEMQYMTYQYQNYGLLNDVTFVELRAINRGTQTFYDLAYGLQTNMFVGATSDDYYGADSLRNMFYVYNSNDVDATLGSNPGVIGVVALEDPLSSVISNPWPSSVSDTWDLMHGNYPGGIDIQDNLGNPTSFIYHDNPSNGAGYSQEALGNASTFEPVYIASNRNVFAPGDTLKQTFAFVYVEDGNRLQSVNSLYIAAEELHSFYDTIANAHCEDGVLSALDLNDPLELQLMPNPASSYVDILVEGANVLDASIVDVSGKIVANGSGSGSIRMNTSALSDGAYFVRIKSGDSVVTKKLVIAQ